MKKYIAAIFITSIVFYFTACIQNKKEETSATKTESVNAVSAPVEPVIPYTQFISEVK